MNIPYQLPRQPEEGFLEVIIGLRRDLKVLEVLLPMEGNRSGLDFSFLLRFNRLAVNFID